MVAKGLPWSPNGGTVVAQCTLLVGQRRHNGGTREAEAAPKLMHNVYNRTHVLTGRPMADPCVSILRPWRCVCRPPASFERSVNDRPPRRPLCDCFEHAQNFTATIASIAKFERPLRHPWTTKATLRPPLCLRWLPVFVVTQGRRKGRRCYNDRIALKLDRHLGRAAAEVTVKFKSDWKSLNLNLAASRSCGKTSVRLVNRCPGS